MCTISKYSKLAKEFHVCHLGLEGEACSDKAYDRVTSNTAFPFRILSRSFGEKFFSKARKPGFNDKVCLRLMLSRHVPSSEKQSGEARQISWGYEIRRVVIIA